MNRFALKFTPELETEYLAASLPARFKVIRLALGIIIVISGGVVAFVMPLLVAAGWSTPVVSKIIFRSNSLGVAIASVALGMTFVRRLDRHYQLICSSTMFILNLFILAVVHLNPELFRDHGLIYLYVAVASAIPSAFAPKIANVAFMTIGNLTLLGMTHAGPDVFLADVTVPLVMLAVLSLTISYLYERSQRQQFLLKREAESERTRANEILRNVFPSAVAERLLLNPDVRVVDDVADAAVMFADLVGFTRWSAGKQASTVVSLLDQLFSRFDALTSRANAQKIKTIGDAYMVAVGVPVDVRDQRDPALVIADLALEFRAAVLRFRLLTGMPIEIRIGINAGPVTAGIIGRSRFNYDLWGETVNLASRLESTCDGGQIHMSSAFAARLGETFIHGPREATDLKGLGSVSTCLLVNVRHPKAEAESDLLQSA